MAESLISYELYALIQSIINKQTVQVALSPNLLVPSRWIGDYTGVIQAQQTGAITSYPTVLPKPGSYTFQLETTIQYTGGSYNADSLEVRLYYAPLSHEFIAFDVDPYYTLTTQQLNDPTAEGVINAISRIVVPNVGTDQQYQLGYATVSSGSGDARIHYTIHNVFFTQFSGVQNDQTIYPPFVTVNIPTPTVTTDDVLSLGVSIPCNGLVAVCVNIKWAFPWLDELLLFVSGNTQGPRPPFPYTVMDGNRTVLPVNQIEQIDGQGWVFGFGSIGGNVQDKRSITSTSYVITSPTGTLADIPLWGLYQIQVETIPTPDVYVGDPYDNNLGISINCEGSDHHWTYSATLNWDILWNAQPNYLRLIGFAVNSDTFPYTVKGLDGAVLPFVRKVQVGGQTVFYFSPLYEASSTTTSWSFTLFSPLPSISFPTNLTVWGYY